MVRIGYHHDRSNLVVVMNLPCRYTLATIIVCSFIGYTLTGSVWGIVAGLIGSGTLLIGLEILR